MSRRRNRNRSLSNRSQLTQRSKTPSLKKGIMFQSTAQSFYVPQETHRSDFNYDTDIQDKLYNRNIAHFRDNFNANDPSQLPFMSSLRGKSQLKPQTAKKNTICFPFQAAMKNTSNQIIKKNISDFSSKQIRLSGAYYRWHNKTGRNNKWVVDFQCSLRDYGSQHSSRQKDFYPYIKPIKYKDIEERQYDANELICTRHNKSFKIR